MSIELHAPSLLNSNRRLTRIAISFSRKSLQNSTNTRGLLALEETVISSNGNSRDEASSDAVQTM